MKRALVRWAPALILMIVIFVASSVPQADLPQFGLADFLLKKAGHMLGYALLGAAYLRALAGDPRQPARTEALGAALLASLYAASDEVHQSFVPGRGATFTDVLIDSVGAACGVWLYRAWLARRRSGADPVGGDG